MIKFQTEEEVEKRLHTALNEWDKDTLAYFGKFGTDVRQQIRNVRLYEQYTICGYMDSPQFDMYGWCTNGGDEVKDRTEEIHLYDESHNWYARAFVLQHPNGKWVQGHGYSTPLSGSYCTPSIWSTWYDTREEALRAVYDIIEKHFLEHASEKALQRKKILDAIARARLELRQASLFADEPIPVKPAATQAAPANPAKRAEPVQLTLF